MKRPQPPFHIAGMAAALRSSLVILATALAAPAFAAPQGSATTVDPSAFVRTAAPAKKPAAKPKAATAGKKAPAKKGAGTAKKNAQEQGPGPLADFGKVDAPDDVVHVANWVSYTRNNKKKAFVLIDKKQAQLYVFDPRGKLKSRTPILLGKAIGDHTVPGVGDKPLSQVKEDEKTTPAGRFQAIPGRNTSGEDIIWIDYAASVSMHRLRKVAAEERRAERMATPEADDNRISYGCVNVPAKFYDGILKPTVVKQGAIVYVLPETKTPQQQFGSYDVPPASAKG
jgi:hypothetical protein